MTISLPKELGKDLKEYADNVGVSVETAVTNAIKRHLETGLFWSSHLKKEKPSMELTLTNDFHKTSCKVRPHRDLTLSTYQVRRAHKKLCPGDCLCGHILGDRGMTGLMYYELPGGGVQIVNTIKQLKDMH